MKWLERIRSEHGSIVMAQLLTGPHKKRLRFRRWSVRRRSPLMKCILHYLSAVLWQLSTDKIDTDVVKDSAVLEWEHSPQSVCAINSSLCALLWLMVTNSILEAERRGKLLQCLTIVIIGPSLALIRVKSHFRISKTYSLLFNDNLTCTEYDSNMFFHHAHPSLHPPHPCLLQEWYMK